MITILATQAVQAAEAASKIDPTIVSALIAGGVAVFTNAGLWSILQKMQQHRYDKEMAGHNKAAETLEKLEKSQEEMLKTLELQGRALKGIGHDRIVHLGKNFCKRGYITPDEYENLKDYLYKPYKDLGGNGTAEKMMDLVEQLPVKDNNNNNKG